MSKQNKVVGTFTKVTRVFPGCLKKIPWNKPVNGVFGWCTFFGAFIVAGIVLALNWM